MHLLVTYNFYLNAKFYIDVAVHLLNTYYMYLKAKFYIDVAMHLLVTYYLFECKILYRCSNASISHILLECNVSYRCSNTFMGYILYERNISYRCNCKRMCNPPATLKTMVLHLTALFTFLFSLVYTGERTSQTSAFICIDQS